MENIFKYGAVYVMVIVACYFSAYEFNRIVEKLDDISKSMENVRIDNIHTRDSIDNHERRIQKLEDRRP